MDFLPHLALDKVGYALAAIASFVFFLLLLVTRVKNLQRLLLLCWTLVCCVWASYYLLYAVTPYSTKASLLFELLRYYVLLLFLITALNSATNSFRLLLQNKAMLLITATVLVWYPLCYWQLISDNLIFTGSLALCILQLAFLEALYRRSGNDRWQYKPMVISLGLCLLFDFVLLAESALFAQVDNQLWAARGYVCAALLPLIIVSVRRISAWGISVYVSRDIVLQSSLVLASGGYLCLIAIAGFYIRYVGGNWSNLLQATFFALGFAMLAFLLFSGALRRKLKVFIEKHFFANKFDYRQKWLELTRMLRQIDLSKARQYDAILQAWLSAVGYSRGCLVRLPNSTSPHCLAVANRALLTADELTLISRYQASFAKQHWIVDLSDKESSFVRQQQDLTQLDVQLILPIHADGELWGLCMINTPDVDKQQLNWELRDYLMLVTEQTASYLLLMEASKIFSENAQFAAFSRMSAFVVHDLKNVKAQIDLTLQNAKKHRHNPEFIEDTFDTLSAMQQRLENMLAQLNNKRHQNETVSAFDAAEVVRQVITLRCAGKKPVPQFTALQQCQLQLNKERFSSVIYHLLDNAQHATAEHGRIDVSLDVQQNQLVLQISDNGCGMSADFISNRLFKPFDSTKGNSGMGVGAYDALHFAQQHNGQLLVKSTEGSGTTFTLTLPLQ
ncbi:MAG: PEP-CTERM system histidine kinase PrsK [Gammaproteobacteria bacterium]|nr:PEP-CTERM system histidine kinase PrsK [Gammaproteobacteria bacterium]MBU2071267.1 PEP-CTERM system histidine kinase PrsK [Gammaproteobacteria bacterium]MBU2181674.1 PEP-CTERM system histidine kinase PrsK [Gammaproteobacteria bacterium]MBU2205338.1 PEP-CTERM system histidine kinase PrsK [Gammaproteobacteria bacterium]